MGTAAVLGPAAAVGSATALAVDTVAGGVGAGVGLGAASTGAAAAAGAGASVATEAFAAASMAARAVAVAVLPTGPFGWVIAGASVVSGLVILAGDETSIDARCWEDVLKDHKMDQERVDFHAKHGMLFHQAAKQCDVFKSEDDGKLLLRNNKGEYYAFSISLQVPAGSFQEGVNAEHDVSVVHAVRAELAN